jgi:type IV secretory pathway VirB2 component (pilin)
MRWGYKHVQRMHWTPSKVASTFTENSHSDFESGGFMKLERSFKQRRIVRRTRAFLAPLAIFLIVPLAAHAQGTPFDTGFQALQNLFTGTVAKVASLIAIVIGGYQFAHGEPGAKRALAGVAAGTGIAVLATNVLTWLWG